MVTNLSSADHMANPEVVHCFSSLTAATSNSLTVDVAIDAIVVAKFVDAKTGHPRPSQGCLVGLSTAKAGRCFDSKDRLKDYS